jgi:hypothetical protein
MNQNILLNNITLCTFSTGHTMVREVLEDWFDFLGGKPGQVIFATLQNPPQIYEELLTERLVDQIIRLESNNRSIYEVDPEGIRAAVEAAKTDWVLLVKLDTLPFRIGNENWLNEDMRAVQEFNCLGLTGSGSTYYEIHLAKPPYSKIQCFSNNFSILKRKDWLSIQDTYIGKNFDGPLLQDPKFKGDDIRGSNEEAITTYLREKGQYMLVRWQTMEWSVFHVNVWGEKLKKVRELYLERKGVERYLFSGEPHARSSYNRPWIRFYGYPFPSLFYRLKFALAIRTRLKRWQGKRI